MNGASLVSRARHRWDQLSSSYWFVPTVMMVGAGTLALGMVWADLKVVGEPSDTTIWLYTGGAQGARSMLSIVAGSVITVAGVGFSITIVTLTQASSQFGPRLLRTFMRDRGNQVVLGTWVGTFIYGVLVLRTVRGGDDGAFVPHASVSVAVLLAMASVGALVYFIDHVSFTLQAPQLVAAVSRDLDAAIRRVFPAPSPGAEARGTEQGQPLVEPPREARPISSTDSGYLQAIDAKTVMHLAEAHDLTLYIAFRPGDFVHAGDPLLRAAPPGRVDDDVERSLQGAFFLGAHATDQHNPEFPINQLVEVAVRALSPGINDPFTAIHCIDWLGASIARLAGREQPSPLLRDAHGVVRVVARTYSFRSAVDAAFDQIRQHPRASLAVSLRLLDVLGDLGAGLRTEQQREAVRRQVRLTYEGAHPTIDVRDDREDLERRFRRAMARLENPRPMVGQEADS